MNDLICWIICGVGTLLCVYLFYLNDFDIEETLFRHTSTEDKGE